VTPFLTSHDVFVIVVDVNGVAVRLAVVRDAMPPSSVRSASRAPRRRRERDESDARMRRAPRKGGHVDARARDAPRRRGARIWDARTRG
jgi:hypothetical protein